MTEARLAAVVVLAAGEGKRMRSTTPKVLHPLCGRSLLGHVLAATDALGPDRTVVVVGRGRDQVEGHLETIAPSAVATGSASGNMISMMDVESSSVPSTSSSNR